MKCPECNGRGYFLFAFSTPRCTDCLGKGKYTLGSKPITFAPETSLWCIYSSRGKLGYVSAEAVEPGVYEDPNFGGAYVVHGSRVLRVSAEGYVTSTWDRSEIHFMRGMNRSPQVQKVPLTIPGGRYAYIPDDKARTNVNGVPYERIGQTPYYRRV